MRDFELVRAFRTPSSERFLLRKSSTDAGALDIHYLADGSVQATLVLASQLKCSDAEIVALLKYLDESLLPAVSLDAHTLAFTVVVGDILGEFHAQPT